MVKKVGGRPLMGLVPGRGWYMARIAALVVIVSLVVITQNQSMAQVVTTFQALPGKMILAHDPVGRLTNTFPPASGSIKFNHDYTYNSCQGSEGSTTLGPGSRTYNNFRTPIGSITFGLGTCPPPDTAP